MEQLRSNIWGTKRSVGADSVLNINGVLRIVNPTIGVRHCKSYTTAHNGLLVKEAKTTSSGLILNWEINLLMSFNFFSLACWSFSGFE